MQVIYYNEEIPYKFSKSIFLAGPSYRSDQDGESWRKTALQILQDKGFDGVIYVPENRKGKLDENHDYDGTVSWEQEHLDMADCILFWVPRSEELPAYTTNIEWGKYYDTGRVALGFPEDAPKMKYFKHCAEQNNIPIYDSLTATIEHALEVIGDGAERTLGERFVPLILWRTKTFQDWYKDLLEAGNRLESLKTLLTVRPKNDQDVAIWVIRPNIYIAKEDRLKDNEVVLGRTDISSVCMWKRVDEDFDIVLVKEFRSAVSNDEGCVCELPSGSSPNELKTDKGAAVQEVREETGLDIDEDRLEYVGTRQLCGTMMSHKSHLFSYELNDEEIEWLRSQKGIAKGIKKDGERTFIEVAKLSDIMENGLVDWTHIGQILAVVSNKN